MVPHRLHICEQGMPYSPPVEMCRFFWLGLLVERTSGPQKEIALQRKAEVKGHIRAFPSRTAICDKFVGEQKEAHYHISNTAQPERVVSRLY